MASNARSQRGGFALGLVVGLLIGLALALGVALYVTKVPIPFVNKVPQRTAEQDAAEAEKNRNWNPNAPLAGRAPAGPASDAAAATPAPTDKAAPANPAATVAGPANAAPAAAPGASATAGLQFFVQVGAYARGEDAEQQRARLGLSGLVGRITEREQGGKLVYRLRLGPFEAREEADAVREQAVAAGFGDATLVRVAR